jgi:hypothetical protein
MAGERYLVTYSLLNAWNYMFSCRDVSEDGAKEDFLRTLRREKGEKTEAMLKGSAFEDEVYKEVAGAARRRPHPDWEEGIVAVAAMLKGAQTQVILSRETEIAGRRFLLYGISDALKAGVIYDVKFTVKSFEKPDGYTVGKYLTSPQHPMYLSMLPEAYEFRYLISDGTDAVVETYRRRETRPAEDLIAEFIASVDAMGLLPLYEEKWLAK